jgi:hypothetical protein
MSIHSSIRELSLHGKDEGWKQEREMDTNSGSKYSSKIRREVKKVLSTNSYKIAITHVAYKMITIIWHMLVNKKLCDERK